MLYNINTMLKFEIDDKRHNFRLEIRRKHL